MSIKQIPELTVTRLPGTSGTSALRASGAAVGGGANKAFAGAIFTWMWYRHPERLMSQSERLPT